MPDDLTILAARAAHARLKSAGFNPLRTLGVPAAVGVGIGLLGDRLLGGGRQPTPEVAAPPLLPPPQALPPKPPGRFASARERLKATLSGGFGQAAGRFLARFHDTYGGGRDPR